MYKELDGLIGFLADYTNDNLDARSFSQTKEFSVILKDEAERVRKVIHDRIYSFQGDSRNAANYVCFLQARITYLSNQVNDACPEQSYLGATIDGLLDFLQHDFKSYFNGDLNAPLSFILDKIASRASLVKKVNEVFFANSVDAELSLLIDDYLTQNGYSIKSFEQLDYYMLFCERLSELCAEKSALDMQTRLLQRLMHMNFNSHSFIVYCTMRFTKKYDDLQDILNFEMETVNSLRMIKQSPQHVNLAYDKSDRSLKAALEEVVNHEMTYINEVKLIKSTDSFFSGDEPYFQVMITLKEIAFFFRLVVEEGLIEAPKKLFLHLFISKYIGTKNKPGRFSTGSIKNKYSNNEQATVDAVQTYITRLLNRITKHHKVRSATNFKDK